MEQEEVRNPIIEIFHDKKFVGFFIYEMVVSIVFLIEEAYLDFLEPMERVMWVVGFLILGAFFIWREIGRFLRRHIEGVVAFYLVVITAILWFGILDLTDASHRALFQGLTALGLALFVFFQFNLDYQNRKRNILYEKQIDALMEYHSIVSGIILFLEPVQLKESQYPEYAIEDLKNAIEKYSTFINFEKWLFVRGILERSGVNKDTLTRNFLLLQQLIVFLEKEGSKFSKLTEKSLDKRIKFYDPSLLDPKERKLMNEAVQEFSQKSVPIIPFSKDKQRILKKMQTEMSLREAVHVMWKFTLKMKSVIQQELGVL